MIFPSGGTYFANCHLLYLIHGSVKRHCSFYLGHIVEDFCQISTGEMDAFKGGSNLHERKIRTTEAAHNNELERLK